MDPEGHPIPQDITGFQFRLIGDMTVKQFAYLAGGAISAWFFYSIPLPTVFKIPLVGGFVLLGIMLAFMPIHGRPADVMLMLFLKAIFKPNQFKYKSSPVIPSPFDYAQGKLVEESTSAPVAQVASTLTDSVLSPQSQPAPTQTATPTNPIQQPAISPSPAPPPIPAPPQSHPLLPNLPPDAINLIAGVVEDPRGNVLQNILVDVKDPAGSPVRAFKTNQMGQFIAATPLSNGTYTITFEDPDKRHQFPTLTITATGAPITPIEVKSMDQREQLRQTLFTTTAVPPVQNSN